MGPSPIQTCFIRNRGRVTVFLAGIKLLHVAKLIPNTHKCIEHAKCIET